MRQDVESLGPDLVSLTMITDPMGSYQLDDLEAYFPDVVRPFKEHFVCDLHASRMETVSQHHRYYSRKALRGLKIEAVHEPEPFIDEWMDLHQHLIKRHAISGVRAFSRRSFLEQFRTPGVVLMRAVHGQRALASMMLFVQNDVAHAHILGCSPEGYKAGALYAIFWSTWDVFDESVRWCNLMGVPGSDDESAKNIRWFKRGFTPITRTAYLCGKVLNQDRYDELAASRAAADMPWYFPLYRAGEML
ncbi:MAG: hypothetical protein GXP23_10585 [Gammaproteobacteria bacterium]|nr:hypothetical protein [Gammaproteobacteria bacterium]